MTRNHTMRHNPSAKGEGAHEDGAVLLIVLMIVTVIGLVLGAVLGQAAASMKSTSVVQSHYNKVYAADAGLDWGIQQMKRDNTLCPNAGMTATLPTQTF